MDEDVIEKALIGLREKGLVVKLHAAGARALKYRHTLPLVLDLDAAQSAILTVLLLRGVQSAGELKQRTERMHEFATLDAVEECLQWFIGYPNGALVQRQGRRVETVCHLLGGSPTAEMSLVSGASLEIVELEAEQAWRSRLEAQVAELRQQVEELNSMVQQLREELGA